MISCKPSQGSHISSHEQKEIDSRISLPLSIPENRIHGGRPRYYYQGSSLPLYDKNLPDFSGVKPSIYMATTR